MDNAAMERCKLESCKTAGLGVSGAKAFPLAKGPEVFPSLLPLRRLSALRESQSVASTVQNCDLVPRKGLQLALPYNVHVSKWLRNGLLGILEW